MLQWLPSLSLNVMQPSKAEPGPLDMHGFDMGHTLMAILLNSHVGVMMHAAGPINPMEP